MKTKSVLYAAVGAPVVAARKVSDQYGTFKTKVGEERANYSDIAQKAIEDWASEGEKVVSNVQDKKVVEEISSKVDLDQAKEQVTKLRDQLEDMLATWRHSFRPEKDQKDEAGDGAVTADTSEVEPAADDPAPAEASDEEPAGDEEPSDEEATEVAAS